MVAAALSIVPSHEKIQEYMGEVCILTEAYYVSLFKLKNNNLHTIKYINLKHMVECFLTNAYI